MAKKERGYIHVGLGVKPPGAEKNLASREPKNAHIYIVEYFWRQGTYKAYDLILLFSWRWSWNFLSLTLLTISIIPEKRYSKPLFWQRVEIKECI